MPPRLSARQEQCVRLTAFRTDKEIAAHLGISEATVKKHIHEACQRLGVNRRKAALAILEQNGPGYPNNPMPKAEDLRSISPFEGEDDHGGIRWAAAALELGRPGDGARPAGIESARPSAARTSAEAFEERGPEGYANRTADGLAGYGGSGGPDAILGYRPPPRGSLLRLTLIALGALVISTTLIAVAGMVSDFHHVIDRFDLHHR